MLTPLSTSLYIRGRFNAAIICGYFMADLNDKSDEAENFSSSKTYKNNQILKSRPEFIEEFS